MIVAETPRLRLRWLTADDAAFILALVNDPSWIANIGDKGIRDLDGARRYIETGPKAMVARFGFGLNLIETRDGTPVGLCGLIKRDSLPDVDLEAARQEAEKACGHQIDDNDLASWLMYPKVYREFSDHHRRFGDVSMLPTAAYFYGMADRDEIAVHIGPGKTLVIRMQGTAPAEEEGVIKVFFELNGQPRAMRVEKAGAARREQRPQADPTNIAHVPAPMPGMVVTVSVKAGQTVRAGDPLVSLEAMKMETQIRAERDGAIKAVHVRTGETIAARDLLVEFGPA